MKTLLTILAWLVAMAALHAQDINFSQFYQQPMLRNPALTGLSECDLEIRTAYRNQWNSVTKPYKSIGLGAQYHLPYNDGPLSGKEYNPWALGIQTTFDVAGDSKLRRTSIAPAISYSRRLNSDDLFLTAGFMGGIVSSSLGNTHLYWDNQYQNDQYNPSLPGEAIGPGQYINNTQVNYMDLSLGLVLSGRAFEGDEFYVGSALYHWNTPNVSYRKPATPEQGDKLYAKWVLNAGYKKVFSDEMALTFYGDYFVQGSKGQLLSGLFMNYNGSFKGSFGVLYRHNDAIIPSIRIDLANHFIAGFSYDINASRLTSAQVRPRSLEFTLTFYNCKPDSQGSVKCPGGF